MISTAFQGKEDIYNSYSMNGYESSSILKKHLEDFSKIQQVHFCTIQRLNGHVYLLLCTDLEWCVYRIEHFNNGNAVEKNMNPMRVSIYVYIERCILYPL
jgi:hypothetical protein